MMQPDEAATINPITVPKQLPKGVIEEVLVKKAED